MDLKPELLLTLTNLGVTEAELETLRQRMLYSVTSLEGQLAALDAQISALQAQRASLAIEHASAVVTVAKLIEAEASP